MSWLWGELKLTGISVVFGAVLLFALWHAVKSPYACAFCLSVGLGRFLLGNCLLQRKDRERCDEVRRLRHQLEVLMETTKNALRAVADLEDKRRLATLARPVSVE